MTRASSNSLESQKAKPEPVDADSGSAGLQPLADETPTFAELG
jgi:hypothetical protein